eukprot:TRINITY_DN66975_c9_g1_i2.p1 TRINITY_DN66975_c9_g1~~TRINITY_DN66975_c9_g1_i2.p1  ORF type:complete len:363 (-),score=17.75 TRINITY_DN66975_c9_g1_i2:232-1263(-)
MKARRIASAAPVRTARPPRGTPPRPLSVGVYAKLKRQAATIRARNRSESTFSIASTATAKSAATSRSHTPSVSVTTYGGRTASQASLWRSQAHKNGTKNPQKLSKELIEAATASPDGSPPLSPAVSVVPAEDSENFSEPPPPPLLTSESIHQALDHSKNRRLSELSDITPVEASHSPEPDIAAPPPPPDLLTGLLSATTPSKVDTKKRGSVSSRRSSAASNADPAPNEHTTASGVRVTSTTNYTSSYNGGIEEVTIESPVPPSPGTLTRSNSTRENVVKRRTGGPEKAVSMLSQFYRSNRFQHARRASLALPPAGNGSASDQAPRPRQRIGSLATNQLQRLPQ